MADKDPEATGKHCPNSGNEKAKNSVDRSRGNSNQKGSKSEAINVKSVIPKYRQDLLKWNGWGYQDSEFLVNEKENSLSFTGARYALGGKKLPYFPGWVKDVFHADLDNPTPTQPVPKESDYPKSILNKDDLASISQLGVQFSLRGIDRLVRAHGHTLKDIYVLRNGMFPRIPDVVVWPSCHNDVVQIVKYANDNNLVIIPFGGGTAVSGAVECPTNESRPIISLDTSQMNRILWVDKENLLACCESGIIGQDLERELKNVGYTSGHEPDSYEFSSLGGWVATRASGMKKNIYGNIEDLLVHVKIVTPKGVMEKNCQVPRLSCGPDFNHVIMGSEGSLGVITEVVIKIRPYPKTRKYGSMVFPNFESGLKCMREVARRRCQPASIRLMDNEQFKFGMILKPESGFFTSVLDMLKKIYLTKIKSFDVEKLCVMTLLFEGEDKETKNQEKIVYEVGALFGGLPAGQTNGERGYMLTFVIAYIRDLALKYRIVAESFETSVPWDRALMICKNVKYIVKEECEKLNVRCFISCRVTQTYDSGCVIYFYLAFEHSNVQNPVEVHHYLETKARDEIINCGGSISHHHGVGKLRRKWYPETVSAVGVNLYIATKKELDPKNIFATNNMIQSKL